MPSHNAKLERNEQIADAWESGLSMADIARRHEVTAGTVRDVLLRYFERVREPLTGSDQPPGAFQWRLLRRRLSDGPIPQGDVYRPTHGAMVYEAEHQARRDEEEAATRLGELIRRIERADAGWSLERSATEGPCRVTMRLSDGRILSHVDDDLATALTLTLADAGLLR